jgi:DNA-directed RNA polymerase subunit RPC12/RpoP
MNTIIKIGEIENWEDEELYECMECGKEMTENKTVCSNECFNASMR